MAIHSLQVSGVHLVPGGGVSGGRSAPAEAEAAARGRGSGDGRSRIRDRDQIEHIEQLPLVDQFLLNRFGRALCEKLIGASGSREPTNDDGEVDVDLAQRRETCMAFLNDSLRDVILQNSDSVLVSSLKGILMIRTATIRTAQRPSAPHTGLTEEVVDSHNARAGAAVFELLLTIAGAAARVEADGLIHEGGSLTSGPRRGEDTVLTWPKAFEQQQPGGRYGVDQETLYHEPQVRGECARHAANMIAGRPLFSSDDFQIAALHLQREARVVLGPEQAAQHRQWIGNANGNWGREVLELVLGTEGVTLEGVTLDTLAHAQAFLDGPDTSNGFFVNAGQHWWAVVRVQERDGNYYWYALDSRYPRNLGGASRIAGNLSAYWAALNAQYGRVHFFQARNLRSNGVVGGLQHQSVAAQHPFRENDRGPTVVSSDRDLVATASTTPTTKTTTTTTATTTTTTTSPASLRQPESQEHLRGLREQAAAAVSSNGPHGVGPGFPVGGRPTTTPGPHGQESDEELLSPASQDGELSPTSQDGELSPASQDGELSPASPHSDHAEPLPPQHHEDGDLPSTTAQEPERTTDSDSLRTDFLRQAVFSVLQDALALYADEDGRLPPAGLVFEDLREVLRTLDIVAGGGEEGAALLRPMGTMMLHGDSSSSALASSVEQQEYHDPDPVNEKILSVARFETAQISLQERAALGADVFVRAHRNQTRTLLGGPEEDGARYIWVPANFTEMLDASSSWASLPVWRGVWFRELVDHENQHGSVATLSWCNEWRAPSTEVGVGRKWMRTLQASCGCASGGRKLVGCGSCGGGSSLCVPSNISCFDTMSSCVAGICSTSGATTTGAIVDNSENHGSFESSTSNRHGSFESSTSNHHGSFESSTSTNVPSGSFLNIRSRLEEGAHRRYANKFGAWYKALADDPVFRPPLAARQKASYIIHVLANVFLSFSFFSPERLPPIAEGDPAERISVRTAMSIVAKTRELIQTLTEIISQHDFSTEEHISPGATPDPSLSFDSSSFSTPPTARQRHPLILKLLVRTFAEALRNHHANAIRGGPISRKTSAQFEAALRALAAKMVSDVFKTVEDKRPNSCQELLEKTYRSREEVVPRGRPAPREQRRPSRSLARAVRAQARAFDSGDEMSEGTSPSSHGSSSRNSSSGESIGTDDEQGKVVQQILVFCVCIARLLYGDDGDFWKIIFCEVWCLVLLLRLCIFLVYSLPHIQWFRDRSAHLVRALRSGLSCDSSSNCNGPATHHRIVMVLRLIVEL